MSKYEKLEPVFAELDSGDEHIHPMFNSDFDIEGDAPRRKTPFLVIASLLVLALAGGGLVFAYKQGVREGNRTAPPIIKASTKKIKTEPKKPGGIKIPNQNKRVYDRLDKKPLKVAERLMPSAEEIMDLPKKPVISNLPEVLESSGASAPGVEPGGDAVSTKDTEPPKALVTSDLNPSDRTAPLPTHEVDVFTITPDGVFPGTSPPPDVPANVAEKIIAKAPEIITSAPEPAPVVPAQPVAVKRIVPPPIPVAELPELEDGKTLTERLLETESKLSKRNVNDGAPVSKPIEALPIKNASRLVPGSGIEEPSPLRPLNAVEVASLPPLPMRKPIGTSSSKPLLPVTIRPVAVVKTVAIPASTGRGRFVVQIASHRRQVDALAEYAGLKRRHPGVIGNYKPSVQRADLGDRGIYYRLRIGPLASKAEATSFCESLKAAGKPDCLIRRR